MTALSDEEVVQGHVVLGGPGYSGYGQGIDKEVIQGFLLLPMIIMVLVLRRGQIQIYELNTSD